MLASATLSGRTEVKDDVAEMVEGIISLYMDDYNASNGDAVSRRRIIGRLRNELNNMVGGEFADRTIAALFYTNETAEVMPPVEPDPTPNVNAFVSFKAARHAA